MTGALSTPEVALLDATHLMHRGDYSGAVRRIVTAIEVLVDERLRNQLSQTHPPTDVDLMIKKTRNNFPERLRQLLQVTGISVGAALHAGLDATRKLRHEIVHGGRRITYAERGLAQMCVDKGRFLYSAIEADPHRLARRNKLIALRSLGQHVVFFNAFIDADGVEIDSLTAPRGTPPLGSPR